MNKTLNRNQLKMIALAAMFIDHIGYYFLNDNIYFRILGRVAFPIFAFFIAQGYFYTKDRKKYFLTILGFGVISQLPYYLFLQRAELNILFTFVFAIMLIYLVEYDKQKQTGTSQIMVISYHILLIMLYIFDIISYGYFGVLIPVVFYFYKDSKMKYVYFAILNLLVTLPFIIAYPTDIRAYIQLFALFDILLFMIYNDQKGKYRLKYLFYIIYPVHMLLFYFIKLLM